MTTTCTMGEHTMVTIFDLPLYDVLFPRIFCYLDAWEIWDIRTVSKRFCRLCWQFFRHSLTSLCVDLTTLEPFEKGTIDSLLEKLTAAKIIIRVSTQLKNFNVHMPPSFSHLPEGKDCIETLLSVLADASPQLRQLCITHFESLPFGSSVAKKLGQCCSQLTELVLWNVNPVESSFDVILLNILHCPILTLTKLSLSAVKFCEKDTLYKCALNISNLKNFTVRLIFDCFPVHNVCIQYVPVFVLHVCTERGRAGYETTCNSDINTIIIKEMKYQILRI